MKSKKGFIVLAVFLAACAAIILWAFVFGKKKDDGKNGKGRGRGGNTEFSVVTKILEEETLHDYVIANGEIESQNSVSVFPDSSGKIVSTRVQLGSKVSRGSVVAYVDPSRPGERYNNSPVYAPISGNVITTPLEAGTTVNTSTAIMKIGDITKLQIVADIPERYVSFLQEDLKALVSVEAYPNVTFAATVVRVSPVVDPASRTKQIVLNFDEYDERVNAGMFAKLTLFTKDYSGAVTMPAESLVTHNEKYFAYVVRDGETVERREVTLGQNVGGIVQILNGLSKGERVVVQGQTSLSDGAKVKDISGSPNAQNANSGKGDESAKKPATVADEE